MPGLSEMHAHIPPPSSPKQRIEDVLFLYLSNGITLIRGMLGDSMHLRLRSLADTGELLSPRIYTSSTVLNSVLFSNDYKQQSEYPLIQQHFVGFFIKTKEKVFDDSAATFMDFTVSQNGNTRFMYVLPYTKNEALFEYTLFSKDLLSYDDYVIEIENFFKYLKKIHSCSEISYYR